jgi:hypothetical protein
VVVEAEVECSTIGLRYYRNLIEQAASRAALLASRGGVFSACSNSYSDAHHKYTATGRRQDLKDGWKRSILYQISNFLDVMFLCQICSLPKRTGQ